MGHSPDSALRKVFETGTNEPSSAARTIAAGDISAIIDAGALRCVAYGPLELVRQIDFPVRDQNWGTLPPKVTRETFEEQPDGFRYQRHFEVDDGALSCSVTYQLRSDGTVHAIGEATAARDFITNRTGFTLLHPIAGVAGKPVVVTTSAGTVQAETMPETISPAQPIKDIAGLAFSMDGVSLDIAFSGDVFEMEDQRNWSDASFKTYSRPLVEPFAYVIKAGTTIRQDIHLRITGRPVPVKTGEAEPVQIGPALDEALPDILLAAQAGWLPDSAGTKVLAASGLSALLLRTTADDAATDLTRAGAALQALSGSLDLEIVLEDNAPALPQLERVASACRDAGCRPRHLIALPKAYLKSYQPGGQWPDGLSPYDAYVAARQAFPDARIGSGMLSNFTEFNRCRPDGLPLDFMTHGNAAIVHAADDASVAQTIETLPDIFRSARAIGANRSYRLGLAAIGMRSNPYGDAVSPNPDQIRLTMATWDPRARALFGAAWAAAALAKTEGFAIEAMALTAPIGPFGILAAPGPVARPWFDDHEEASVYPIFHALRFVAGGGQRLQITGIPTELAALAFASKTGRRMMIANLSGKPHRIRLADTGRVACLDADRFEAAVTNPDWLDSALTPVSTPFVDLASPSVLFLEAEDTPKAQ
ncbi:MAG: hypothetical protein P1V13_13560 [Rhizobiaceae bacterium]|nr:hypothetical protein [Rhizobiaceae bacterium]